MELLPHTILTHPSSHTLLRSTSIPNLTLISNTISMADPTLLAKAHKARFDNLPNYSGHPSEDVERFLKSIKNITKANDESENHEILEIVRGKLTQSAGIWFDNNESTFRKCSDFEPAFRNRYFSTTLIHKKFDKLKQRTQLHDELVTSYFDDVVDLCREIDSNMPEPIIIQHLMSGINPEFKKELSRRESSMNTLKEFLKYVKIEQDLYETFEKSRNQSPETQQQPYFELNRPAILSLTAMVKQSTQRYYTKRDGRRSYPTSTQSSAYQRNSIPQARNNSLIQGDKQIRNFSKSSFNDKPIRNQSTTMNKFNNCKICGRKNHRTIDCFHKRSNGCFNCGQNHVVRDCSMPPNFQ